MAKISFLSGAGNQTTLEGLSRAVTHMYKRNGVILSTDLAVSENDTPDTNVKVATGAIVIGFDGSYPEDAYYYGFSDATELVAISANVSGNARIDAIVAYVDTANPGTTDNDGALVFTTVEGTPAGSPTAPSDNDIQTDLGAGVRWHRLANVTVANGFATITNANIADTRDRTFIESAKIGGTVLYADSIEPYSSATDVTIPTLIPSGVIVMWSGSVASIPSGWLLCNGANGTPDLRDRFIVGAGSTYSVDATGGSADAVVVTHTHTQNAHTHTQNAHTHTLPVWPNHAYTGTGENPLDLRNTSSTNSGSTTATNQNTTATNQNTGVSGTNANLPPYYALAYIMKM